MGEGNNSRVARSDDATRIERRTASTSGLLGASPRVALCAPWLTLGAVMIMFIVLLVRLMIMCMVMTVRLSYWLLKLMIMGIVALTAAIGGASAARKHKAVRR